MLKVIEIMMRMAFLILGNPGIITTQYPFPHTQSLLWGVNTEQKKAREA